MKKLWVLLARITPARAGNRAAPVVERRGSADHPRACGEQASGFRMADLAMGSPPRVRGTDEHTFYFYLGPRITPARAGNSP